MGNPKFRRIKQCIFCGNKANSGEHAWSAWAIGHIAFEGGLIGKIEDIRYYDRAQKNLKVRCVCVKCNTVWMRALEETVRPLITKMMDGRPVVLDIPQQWAIARWGILKAMVFEHMQRKVEAFYTPHDYQLIKSGDVLPHSCAVWLAMSEGGTPLFAGGGSLASTSDVLKLHGHITTVAYQMFVIQVITIRSDQVNYLIPFLDGDGRIWGDTVISIWPALSTALWPKTNAAISSDALPQFHCRFSSNPDCASSLFSTEMG